MAAEQVGQTPGPWRVIADGSPFYKGVVAILRSNTELGVLEVGSKNPDHVVTRAEDEANAHLIAAAPYLLAAAEAAVEKLDPDGLTQAVSDATGGAGLYGTIVRDLRAAIQSARARGEEVSGG